MAHLAVAEYGCSGTMNSFSSRTCSSNECRAVISACSRSLRSFSSAWANLRFIVWYNCCLRSTIL